MRPVNAYRPLFHAQIKDDSAARLMQYGVMFFKPCDKRPHEHIHPRHVNVASKCGLTPQYEGLEALYETYREQGLEVLGFPANEFLAQEPGSNDEIAAFCRGTFGVEFPMFAKIVVKGEGQHPLYQRLTAAIPTAQALEGGKLKERLEAKGLIDGQAADITWNFEKFLVNKQGEVVARFMPDVPPQDAMIVNAITAELAK